jgi:hypothetical protein
VLLDLASSSAGTGKYKDGAYDDDATLTGDTARVVRLHGEVRVPAGSHPSFRSMNMAREVRIFLFFAFTLLSWCTQG